MDATAEGADVVYKLLLLGESNVGKTSIILRYIENKFEESNISTCGIDLKCKYVSCDDKKIKLKNGCNS
jgi:GTPase SAR1 family protein